MKQPVNKTISRKPASVGRKSGPGRLLIQTGIDREKDPELYAELKDCSPKKRASLLRSLALKHLLSAARTPALEIKATTELPRQRDDAHSRAPKRAIEYRELGSLSDFFEPLRSLGMEVTLSFKRTPEAAHNPLKANRDN